MSTLLLDTNILSDMMRNLQGPAAMRAMAYSHAHGAEALCISVIVQCELEYGLRRKPNRRLQAAYENILETLTVLPIEASLSPVYARLRTVLDAQGTPMGRTTCRSPRKRLPWAPRWSAPTPLLRACPACR